MLGKRGECEAAVEAFREVPALDPSGSSPLVARAEERIDQIRFGRPLGRPFQLQTPGENPVSCFPTEADGGGRTRRRGG
jgi:hypothetical protein